MARQKAVPNHADRQEIVLLHCSFCILILDSYKKKLENFNHDFLQTLTHLPDIICFSETKLKDSFSVIIDLAGYKLLIHEDSKTNAGGVGAFVSVDLMFTERSKNELNEGVCKNLWLKI